MNNIHSHLRRSVSHFTFSGHDKKRDCGIVQHLYEPRNVRNSCDRLLIQFVDFKPKVFLDEVFQLSPNL